jgi:hypothetical protein
MHTAPFIQFDLSHFDFHRHVVGLMVATAQRQQQVRNLNNQFSFPEK